MANYYTKDTIQSMLDRLENKKPIRDEYMQAKSFEDFIPRELPNRAQPSPYYDSIRESIKGGDETKTAIEMVMAQNRFNFEQWKEAQRNRRRQRRAAAASAAALADAQANQPDLYVPPVGNATGNYNKKRWGADGIPEVSDIAKLNPNAPIVNVPWRGFNIALNRQVAPIFIAFLNDLWATGYRPKVIYGHAERNIAGTNTPSTHSYGFAIDIDPAKNPVTWNGQVITALPKNVGALAAKYGLSWGGAWNGNKTDSMHFSVAYNGTK